MHVEKTGENCALLFSDRLESALQRPKNLFFYNDEYDVVTLSVSLMFSVAQAHAFEQGNKRTGFTSGLAFLFDNGFDYTLPDDNRFALGCVDGFDQDERGCKSDDGCEVLLRLFAS